MIEPRSRLSAQPPTVSPPPPFRERRAAHRRAEDRHAHQEKVLLARALDVLAAGTSAEERLGGILQLLASTAGAEHAAVLADGAERRAAVAVGPDEDPAAAEALAAWLDNAAGRTRAQRAAAGRAPVAIVAAGPHAGISGPYPRPSSEPAERPIRLVPRDDPGLDAPAPGPTPSVVDEQAGRWYALLPIPSAGEVYLGFEFSRPDGPRRLAERLPAQLARHAAVVLALVTDQFAAARELDALRAREVERSRFVSTVAHELRTPLTGLRGYLELITGDKVDDPAVERDFLERSLGIVGSMGDLVGDLLELSRLESGGLTLESSPFSVAEAASDVADALHPIALDRGTRLSTSLPPRLRSATGDRRRVEQILTNLGANALKFTSPGGTVEIAAWFDGSVALVAVRDDGPGIDAEDRPRIFERFHRLAGHERITGTGLGLPIARDLARRMGGDLDVASAPGAGSAFVLALAGPTSADPEAIARALARALREEEIGLEERAVLRALERTRVAGGPAPGRAASGAGGRAGGSARLRAIRPSEPIDATTA